MKRKLKTVFTLITISLTGIIVFQLYWTINAYRINKILFDGKAIVAMQLAMDHCKKDYFDSVRTVLVKRLSDKSSVITIDTPSTVIGEVIKDAREAKNSPNGAPAKIKFVPNSSTNPQLHISFSFHGSSNSNPFQTDANTYNYYRNKIGHKATVAEVLTEMSFYQPLLMTELTTYLGVDDAMNPPAELRAFLKKHPNAPGNQWPLSKEGIYALPPNYQQADSLKISRYFTHELQKENSYARFDLTLSHKAIPQQGKSFRYSETNEYLYQYHGFIYLLPHYTRQSEFTLYVKASFRNPHFAVMRGMVITLTLSLILILFTIFCFYYIIKTLRQQKALGELKDDFINNMTHELKTPIATITVAIESLQKYNTLHDAEKTQRYLQTSRNELNKLNDLVSKVLDVAAFEDNKISLLMEQINIDTLMQEPIASAKAKTNKTIHITYSNKARVDYIVADKLHFSNALMNILDNAVKYTGEHVNIQVEVSQQGNIVSFSVKDNGPGIPAAHLHRIFDKFHRVPAGNIHNVKGTGLGLSYVKYIIETHGGSVTVKSEVNKGSEFILSIPVQS